jgi:Fur family transcriptional regulator, ferric uptake regulator
LFQKITLTDFCTLKKRKPARAKTRIDMESFATNTLRTHELRHTGCREDILTLFYTHKTALAHGDLETVLRDRYDRVTIYRTLKTFADKGIIHKVLDEDGLRYALCKDTCHDHDHHHDHVHFKCAACGQTTCLDEVLIPTIQLPSGYQKRETNLLIQGTCPKCSQ